MSKTNATVIGLAKGHEPKIAEQWTGYKGVNLDSLEIGDVIARRVKGAEGASDDRTALMVVSNIIRNEDLPGGGTVILVTVWNSYERKSSIVNSSASFKSLKGVTHYRIYPYNIYQPTDVQEKSEDPRMGTAGILGSQVSETIGVGGSGLLFGVDAREFADDVLGHLSRSEADLDHIEKHTNHTSSALGEIIKVLYNMNKNSNDSIALQRETNEKLSRLVEIWEGQK